MKEREKSQTASPTLPERFLGEAACLALEYGIRPEIEGEENFIQTKKHLSEGSLILYFNHCSIVDPGLLIEILEKNIRSEIKDWVVPGSQKHLDPKRGDLGPIDSWVMQGFAHKKKFLLFPVVQFYDVETYPLDEVTKINMKFIRRALKALQSPGGVIFIAPEGTRNQKDNRLLKAQRGVGRFLEHGKNTVAQPIALIGSGLPRSVIRNPKVVIGPIYTLEQVREVAEEKALEALGDAMMVLLAQILPQEYRGVYAQYC